jgi:hypothetical protein
MLSLRKNPFGLSGFGVCRWTGFRVSDVRLMRHETQLQSTWCADAEFGCPDIPTNEAEDDDVKESRVLRGEKIFGLCLEGGDVEEDGSCALHSVSGPGFVDS